MDKVFMINVTFSDDETYSFTETVAVCTDEVMAIETEEKVRVKYPDDKTSIQEVETNKIID